jgi:hypothetical protein
MRDSINYNLKYFIMKMSGTKPMKNTMRKPSPAKMMMGVPNPAMEAAKKVTERAKATVFKKKAATKTPPTKMKKSGMGKKC